MCHYQVKFCIISFFLVDHFTLRDSRIADRFFVQWKQLVHKYPRALYAGRLGQVQVPSLQTTSKVFLEIDAI